MANIATDFVKRVKARHRNFMKQYDRGYVPKYSTFNPFKDY